MNEKEKNLMVKCTGIWLDNSQKGNAKRLKHMKRCSTPLTTRNVLIMMGTRGDRPSGLLLVEGEKGTVILES